MENTKQTGAAEPRNDAPTATETNETPKSDEFDRLASLPDRHEIRIVIAEEAGHVARPPARGLREARRTRRRPRRRREGNGGQAVKGPRGRRRPRRHGLVVHDQGHEVGGRARKWQTRFE